MALIGDVEGKVGRASIVPVLLIEPEDLREEHLVRGLTVGVQLPEAVFNEVVGGNSQIAVDVPAVVKPLVAGVAALRRVALASEIPGVGVGIGPVIPLVGKAGQKARSVSTVPPAKILVTRFPVTLSASN